MCFIIKCAIECEKIIGHSEEYSYSNDWDILYESILYIILSMNGESVWRVHKVYTILERMDAVMSDCAR